MLSGLFLTAAVLSFTGFIIQYIESIPANEWDDRHMAFSGRIDFIVATALFLGGLALWRQIEARAGFGFLALPYLLSCAYLSSMFDAPFPRVFLWYCAALLLLAGAIIVVACVSTSRKAARFVSLEALLFVLVYYAIWHFTSLAVLSSRGAPQARLPGALQASFYGARWWHIFLFPVLGLLVLWSAKLLWDDLYQGPESETKLIQMHRRRAFCLVASGVWIATCIFIFQNYSITGLVPVGGRPAPQASFQERMLLRVPASRWYTMLRQDYYPWPETSVSFSPTGERLAYVETSGKQGSRVVAGGVAGPWFDNVRYFYFTFPDENWFTKRLAGMLTSM
jgi:hypothetical protein